MFMRDRPAVLGHSPLFKNQIPIVNPRLPSFAELATEFAQIVSSGTLSKGHNRSEFEEKVADHLGVKHAVAVSSCTAGLMLTYQASGLSKALVVPSFTFMATVSALV